MSPFMIPSVELIFITEHEIIYLFWFKIVSHEIRDWLTLSINFTSRTS